MTEEQTKLLLKDLSARLPYDVKLQISSWDDTNMEYVDKSDTLYYISSDNHIRTSSEDQDYYIDEVKPYLFPMSSMTDEQKEYINGCWGINDEFNFEINPDWGEYSISYIEAQEYIEWLKENHFDYRRLIEKGLAIDATNLNIY